MIHIRFFNIYYMYENIIIKNDIIFFAVES